MMLCCLAEGCLVGIEASHTCRIESGKALAQKSSPASNIQHPHPLEVFREFFEIPQQEINSFIIVLEKDMGGPCRMPPILNLIKLLHLLPINTAKHQPNILLHMGQINNDQSTNANTSIQNTQTEYKYIRHKQMMSNSRGSSRQSSTFTPTEQIFNESFYAQRPATNYNSNEQFSSLAYCKKYFTSTKLSSVIQSSLKKILSHDRLPYNPYSMLYRLVHHEGMYQNLKVYYSTGNNWKLMVNAGGEGQNQNQNQGQSPDGVIGKITVNNISLYTANKLTKYLNLTNVWIVYQILYSTGAQEIKTRLKDKHKFKSSFLSFGGSLIVNVARSTNNVSSMTTTSGKLPKQTALNSLYTAPCMLSITQYLLSTQDQLSALTQFASYILDDCMEVMKYAQNSCQSYFQKLRVTDQHGMLIQYSREQILKYRTGIQTDIARCMQTVNNIIFIKYMLHLSPMLTSILGEGYITVHKRYILIATMQENTQSSNNIFSNQPLTPILREIFADDQYYKLSGVDQIPQVDVYNIHKKEMIGWVMQRWRNQLLWEVGWELFYWFIYEGAAGGGGEIKESGNTAGYLQQLSRSISYLIVSPVAFLHALLHLTKVSIHLLSPNFPTVSQQEAYGVITTIDLKITSMIARGQLISSELSLLAGVIRKLISIILQHREMKVGAIEHILRGVVLLLEGIIMGYHQVGVVLQGTLPQYLYLQRDIFLGKERGDGESSTFIQKQPEDVLLYDQFLKGVKLWSDKVLVIADEVRKYRKVLNMSEQQTREIILGKYIQSYKLYTHIYNFYWNLITSKKPIYPFSVFLPKMLALAVKQDYRQMMEEQPPREKRSKRSKVGEAEVWQMSGEGGEFYAVKDGLLVEAQIIQYRNAFQVILPYIQEEELDSNQLGFIQYSKRVIPTGGQTKVKSTALLSLYPFPFYPPNQPQLSFPKHHFFLQYVFPATTPMKVPQLLKEAYVLVNALMNKMEKSKMAVVGLTMGRQQRDGKQREEVYSKIIAQNNNWIMYDYKKPLPYEKFAKFVEICISTGKLLELRAISTARETLKAICITFNFIFSPLPSAPLSPLFKIAHADKRIFQNKLTLMSWSNAINQGKSKVAPKNKAPSQSPSLNQSIQRLMDDKQVQIVELISDQEIGGGNGKQEPPAYRSYKFYPLLLHSYQLCNLLSLLIIHVKTDRRGLLSLGYFQTIMSLLSYSLLQRCLKSDQYIYSEGVSVAIFNYFHEIEHYIEGHKDNIGDEKELLGLERVVSKMRDAVKFIEISCTVSIMDAMTDKQSDKQ